MYILLLCYLYKVSECLALVWLLRSGLVYFSLWCRGRFPLVEYVKENGICLVGNFGIHYIKNYRLHRVRGMEEGKRIV